MFARSGLIIVQLFVPTYKARYYLTRTARYAAAARRVLQRSRSCQVQVLCRLPSRSRR
ncbi:hypothetical protein ACPA9J_27680 [Pseudomonas aeruginosa]